MKAEEALAMSNQVLRKRPSDKLYAAIEKAAKAGEVTLDVGHFNLTQEEQRYLMADGFDCRRIYREGGPHTFEITWME